MFFFHRGVAQLASASALGAEGREFKSRHPDHFHENFSSHFDSDSTGIRCY